MNIMTIELYVSRGWVPTNMDHLETFGQNLKFSKSSKFQGLNYRLCLTKGITKGYVVTNYMLFLLSDASISCSFPKV